NAGLGAVPEAASPLALAGDGGRRLRRGQLVHLMLQHLPDLAPSAREAALRRFLARPGEALAPDEIATLSGEILAVLDHPDLAPLFGPAGRAEVPLTGLVGGNVVGGLVDRLAVLPDGAGSGRVLVADYKTNRAPPASAAAVPVLYLRQMAAYRAVLAAAFPGYAVECALVWTTGARVMTLPAALLDRNAPGVAA
ncbi:MAG: PD-(D/E)XK nuclease family protein, partial [Rhodospirillales bacterium]|nr:PD-(D/E)XK nuclease family protein [Rhodospirillales bacterium]